MPNNESAGELPIKNINRKLLVNKQPQALEKARGMNLI